MSKRYKSVSDNSIYEEIKSYSRDNENPSVLYNGGYERDEDPADYIKPIKAVRLA